MTKPLKILLAGYIIGFPLGGMVWAMIHHLVALRRLGHEVLFLEDSSTWSYPFDPVRKEYGVDSSYGRAVLEDLFAHHGLQGRWAYYSELEGKLYGSSRDDLDRYCREADLLINVSGLIPLRENYMKARVKAFIDTDPVFTQVKAANDPGTFDYIKAHDFLFTYGCNLPGGATPVPLLGLDWKPTLPPTLLDRWQPADTPGTAYTTLGTWEARDRDIVIDGKRYFWRKSIEYEKIFDLPKLVPPEVRFELAYSGMREAEGYYRANGWTIREGIDISRDVSGYRDYIRSSRGEFTVAKDQNVRLKSGWFSERAACYLASGRPVVTQDCGCGRYLPVGEGLFTFETMNDILAAIEAIEADYPRHRRAARRIAEEHFDAERIMSDLLKEMDLV